MHYLYFKYRLIYCNLKYKIWYSNWFIHLQIWKNRFKMKILITILILLIASLSSAQNSKVFTLEFNHDGLSTDTYEVNVDGIRSVITPVCTGIGATRLCTSPLTLTLNVTHNVSVIAVGTFGEATSIPFVCDVPKVPVNNKVKK